MGRPIKHLIFTFDYELFLGRDSGSADKCVLEPMQALETILSRHGLRHPVIFVDLLWIHRETQNPELSNRIQPVINQLQQLEERGAYIFPHLHPHWMDAKLNESLTWNLSNHTRYRFEQLDPEEQVLVWEKMMETLSLIRKGNYPLGFRAGGWSIQPFELFKPLFFESGIRYEFSVLPGHASKTAAQSYDFSQNVQSEPYRFEDDLNQAVVNGSFWEFPISTIQIKRGLRQRIWAKWLWKTGQRSWGEGESVTAQQYGTNIRRGEMCSVELLDGSVLNQYIQSISNLKTIQFITHPKMISKHNLSCLDRMLSTLAAKFELNDDFRQILP